MDGTHNTHVSKLAFGDWRVDLDRRQDRKPGPVIIRQITEEEKIKYANVKGDGIKPTMVNITWKEREDVDMPDKKIEKERLIELCREHGFGKAAYVKIAKIFGVQWHTIEVRVSRWGIKKILENEIKIMPVTEGDEQPELEIDAPVEPDADLKQNCAERRKSEPMRVYIASSWRNYQMVNDWTDHLRELGFEVFNFTDENDHFVFDKSKLPENYLKMDIIDFLEYPHSKKAFESDKTGLDWCNVCLLLLPSGKSSHLEAGYIKGCGKKLIIYQDVFPKGEADVMYMFADLITDSVREVVKFLKKVAGESV